jgi:hypothetical protein
LANKLIQAYNAIKSAFNTGLSVPHTVNTINSNAFFWDIKDGVSFNEVDGINTITSYNNCPPLNSIINDLALAFSNGKLDIVNPKTLKPIRGEAKQFFNLLNNPNPLQSWKQFSTQIDAIVTLYGYCPVLKVKPDGVQGIEGYDVISQLWILPPTFTTIKRKDNYLFETSVSDMVESITFKVGNQTTTLNKEDVYFFTDVTTSIDDLLFPTSRLTTLKYPINNIIKNFEARGVIVENRGALGIISSDNNNTNSLPMTPQQSEELQKNYRTSYGLSKRQWQIIFTNSAIKFTPMSLPIKDLMLLEMLKNDVEVICHALGMPFNLTPYGSETSFDNQDKAEKRLYQNTVIPKANNFITQLNECIDAPANNILVTIDYSHLPCLQTNKKEAAEVHKINVATIQMQFVNNLITYKNAMLMLGQEDNVENLFFWQMPVEFQASFKNSILSTNNNQDANNNQTSQPNSGGN